MKHLLLCVVCLYFLSKDVNGYRQAMRGKCGKELEKINRSRRRPGQFIPKCESDGIYQKKQCNEGYCFCVNQLTGEEFLGTRAEQRFDEVDCSTIGKCSKQLEEIESRNMKDDGKRVGEAIPTCKADGSYATKQCNEGYCVCVNTLSGEEILGTKATERFAKINCEENCLVHTDRINAGPILLGQFNPTCEKDGKYSKKQCHEGYCFCVHQTTGKELVGSRATERFSEVNCEDNSGWLRNVMNSSECPEGTPIPSCSYSPCARLICDDNREAVCRENFCGGCNAEFFLNNKPFECKSRKCLKACPLLYAPKCGSNGVEYANQCVLEAAQCEDHTIITARNGPCKSKCERLVENSKKRFGSFVHKCENDGSFKKQQCHGSTGYCWCVDTKSGEKLLGTEKRPGKGEVICDIPPLPICLKKKAEAESTNGRPPRVGSFVHECEKDGSFKKHQCHGSTGYCWCVDTETGEKLLGTEKGPGKGEVVCDKPGLLSSSLCLQKKVVRDGSPLGSFVHECEKDGSFKKQQCHGSTGYCWCVNAKTGEKSVGTETGPGWEKFDCEKVHCVKPCARIYQPICANNDQSYNNMCTFEVEKCKNPALEFVYNGKCKDCGLLPIASCSYEPCAKLFCPGEPTAVCKPNFCGGCNAEFFKDGRKINCEKPKCSEGCPYIYQPVCGGDGKTYDNECVFKVAQCKDHSIFGFTQGGCDEKKSLVGSIAVPKANSVKVVGLVKLPVDKLKAGSCLTMSIKEEILCMDCIVPVLARFQRDDPRVNNGEIRYEMTLENFRTGVTHLIEAVVNNGWCQDDDEWIRGGDYFNDTAQLLFPGNDDTRIRHDISLGEFVKQSETQEKQKEVKVVGSIKLPVTQLKPGSCLTMTLKEEILCEGETCDIPILARFDSNDPRINSNGEIRYEMTLEKFNSDIPHLVEAVVNNGWCKNGDDWIKNGDYFNDTSQTIFPNDQDTITYDISLGEYLTPESPVVVPLANGKTKNSVRVVGLVKLPVNDLKKGSCLTMTIMEEILCEFPQCDIPILARYERNNPRINNGQIRYEMKLENFNPGLPHLIQAVVNSGWCKNGDDWIKHGDYFNDTSQTIFPNVNQDTLRYDISLGEYLAPEPTAKPSNQEDCVTPCTREYMPVCGSDGRTYSNKCEFKNAKCYSPELTIKNYFTCKDDVNTGPASVQVFGKVYLPAATTLKRGSCLRMSIREEILCDYPQCDIPVKATYNIDNVNLEEDGSIKYNMTIDDVKDGYTHMIEAVVNNGWCQSSKDDSIKFGDFKNDFSYTINPSINKPTLKKDIDLVEFKEPAACPLCYPHPCDQSTCPAFPNAECRVKFCSCKPEFYVDNKVVSCIAKKPIVAFFSTASGRAVPASFPVKPESCFFVCPKTYKPVCGSDRKTHANDCVMRMTACTTVTPIYKMHEGQCGHCSKACRQSYKPQCGSDGNSYKNVCEMQKKICETVGQVGLAYAGKCDDPDCPQICTADYSPVCGSDKKTYSNKCSMQKASCDSQGRIKLQYTGKCGSCSPICTQEYDPYCGTDDKTYSNKCIMNFHMCRSGGRVQLKYHGKCGNPKCPNNCPESYSGGSKVCGSDGKTYLSGCHLMLDTTCKNPNVYLKHHGQCKTSCKPKLCLAIYKPMCGTDHKTYINKCALNEAVCLSDNSIGFAHRGKCRERCADGSNKATCLVNPCDRAFCPRHPRAQCVTDRCGSCKAKFVFNKFVDVTNQCGSECSLACTFESWPMCGNDGKTYGNMCSLNVERCKTKGRVALAYPGQCKSKY